MPVKKHVELSYSRAHLKPSVKYDQMQGRNDVNKNIESGRKLLKCTQFNDFLTAFFNHLHS